MSKKKRKRNWNVLTYLHRHWIALCSIALILLLGLGVFAKNGWLPNTDAMTGKKTLVICVVCIVLLSLEWSNTYGQTRNLDFSQPVGSIVFSRDGKFFAAASRRLSKTEIVTTVWDTQTWGEKFDVKSDRSAVELISFSPSSRLFAILLSDLDAVEIIFIDTSTGNPLGKYMDKTKLNPRISNYIWGMAFSPDEKTLAIGQESGTVKRTVKLLDIEDLKNITVRKDNVFSSSARNVSLSFSPDGRYLAFATISGTNQDEGKIIVLDLNNGKELLNSKEFGWGYFASFSPDGKMLVASGMDYNDKTKTRDNSLIFYDTTTWKEIKRLIKYPAGIAGLNFSKDGRLLASARGHDDEPGRYEVVLLDTIKMKTVKKYSNSFQDINAMAMSPDGKLVAVGNEKGIVKIFDNDK
jgi:WD40 repeat protein